VIQSFNGFIADAAELLLYILYMYVNKGQHGLENSSCMTAEHNRSNKMYGLTEVCELLTIRNFFAPTSLPLLKCLRLAGLTLSPLMSYIYGAPCKARNFNVVYIYMDLRLATLKAVSFYLLYNVSTLAE
jgi:hypothetical protein